MKAVRFDHYGGIDVLRVAEVPVPEPGPGQVLVKVKAASINPGEAKIREGLLHAMFPATFPSGEGSDLAGIVTKLGPGAKGFAVGDEVIGFTDHRASHAEYVVVEAQNLTTKPAKVSWEAAGTLAIAGCTAYATVRAVSLQPGDSVAVSGAAGGVGSLAVQLARRAGAEVIGIAGLSKHDWLAAHGVKPVAYGQSLADRLREAGLDAFIDTHGGAYVTLAIELGVAPDRIETVADPAAAREYGAKAVGGSTARNAAVLAELAGLVASGDLDVPIAATFPLDDVRAASSGDLDVPIAATFPLDDVRAAFALLEQGHTLGKIVLLP